MFRWLPIVWANLKRRKLRLVFTFISILMAFLMFGMLDALRTSLAGVVNVVGADRLLVQSKVNMIVPGRDAPAQDDDPTIAAATVRCLTAHVPSSVPGVVFLSGGMSDQQATSRLNEMHHLAGASPWVLSFSYGRALQAPALKAWKGDPANAAAAQRAFHHRARLNGAARSGGYSEAMEAAGA